MWFFHPDERGNTLAVSDVAGAFRELRYSPFGRLQGFNEPVRRAFANQTPILGLYLLGARIYDPGLGLFLSPDPSDPVVGNPHDFHRYQYARASPYRFVDYTGYQATPSAARGWSRVAYGLAGAAITGAAIAGTSGVGAFLAGKAFVGSVATIGVGIAEIVAASNDVSVDFDKVSGAVSLSSPFGLAMGLMSLGVGNDLPTALRDAEFAAALGSAVLGGASIVSSLEQGSANVTLGVVGLATDLTFNFMLNVQPEPLQAPSTRSKPTPEFRGTGGDSSFGFEPREIFRGDFNGREGRFGNYV
jgi:RHS repeat-associated protein